MGDTTIVSGGRYFKLQDAQTVCLTLDDGKGKTMSVEAVTPIGVDLLYAEHGEVTSMVLKMTVTDIKITEDKGDDT